MPDDLSLRRAVIGGETAPDDYQVIWDELAIGRIFKTVAVGGHDAWSWTAGMSNIPQRPTHRGRADSLNGAKAAFRKAWDEIKADLSYDQIKEAREIQNQKRSWHR